MQRGFLPDATKDGALYIFKACKHLRLTHELRLAAFAAASEKKQLIVLLPKGASVSAALEDFAAEHRVRLQWGAK